MLNGQDKRLINKDKSSAFFSANNDSHSTQAPVKQALGLRKGKGDTIYLGLPSFYWKIKKVDKLKGVEEQDFVICSQVALYPYQCLCVYVLSSFKLSTYR